MTQQLTKLGCMPAKSLILEFPKWLIDPVLQRHFIRGYFDGDGSIYSKEPTKTGHIDYGWQITSTQSFCENVYDIMRRETDCQFYLAKCSNNITYTLSSGGNLQVQKIMNWLYRDATIYLPRKYEKYLTLLEINNTLHGMEL